MARSLMVLVVAGALVAAGACKKKAKLAPTDEPAPSGVAGGPPNNKSNAFEFTSAAYKFKARFPGQPKEQEQVAAGIKFKMFTTEARDGSFMVGMADMPIPPNEPPQAIEARLDGGRDGAVRNAKGTLKSSTSIKLAGKYPGREFTASITQPVQGLLRGRFYLVGTRLYQVVVVGTDSYATSAEATAFLDSFQLLE